MKCDCIKRVEEKLVGHLKSKAGEGVTASCAATALQLEPDFRMVLQIPFTIRGSMKGFTSAKGKELTVVASYCPFCGRNTKTYEVGQDAGIEAAVHV